MYQIGIFLFLELHISGSVEPELQMYALLTTVHSNFFFSFLHRSCSPSHLPGAPSSFILCRPRSEEGRGPNTAFHSVYPRLVAVSRLCGSLSLGSWSLLLFWRDVQGWIETSFSSPVMECLDFNCH
jgi:hypothetical protein